MKHMKVPAILAAGALAFTLTACSGGAQQMNEDTLKGIWSLESQSDVGFEAYINFEDEQLAEVVLADAYLEGDWSVSGTEGKIDFDDETSAKLTYSGNKLTWGNPNGSRLVFVKDDSNEARSVFEFEDFEGSADGSMDIESMIAGEEPEEGDVEYVDEVINPIEPVTVADDDKVVIKVTGKGTDFTGDPGYQLSITNKTDKKVYLIPEDDFKVGDKTIEAGLGDEVEAGETIETFMYFAKDDLGGALEALGVTDGVVLVLDDSSDEEIASYPFHME